MEKKRIHVTFRSKKGIEALEDFKLLCIKKYGSMHSLSWGIEDLVINALKKEGL